MIEGKSDHGFLGHLEVLRKHLLRIILILSILIGIGFFIIPKIFDSVILAPCSSNFLLYRILESVQNRFPSIPIFSENDFSVEIININMMSQFSTYMTSACYFGLIASVPYVLWEMWRFIAPALYENEKKNIKYVFFFSSFMFFIGCLFGYVLVFPLIFRFLITFNLSDKISNQISLDSYITNFYLLIFIMGLIFELPILCWLLSKFNVLKRSFFTKYRRYSIVITLILAAVINPSGDPISLFAVMLPIYALWEFSALLVKK